MGGWIVKFDLPAHQALICQLEKLWFVTVQQRSCTWLWPTLTFTKVGGTARHTDLGRHAQLYGTMRERVPPHGVVHACCVLRHTRGPAIWTMTAAIHTVIRRTTNTVCPVIVLCVFSVFCQVLPHGLTDHHPWGHKGEGSALLADPFVALAPEERLQVVDGKEEMTQRSMTQSIVAANRRQLAA